MHFVDSTYYREQLKQFFKHLWLNVASYGSFHVNDKTGALVFVCHLLLLHSESLVGPLSSSEPIYPSPSVAMPSLAPSLLGTASSVTPSSSSTPSSVPSSSPFVSAASDYDCGVAPHSRLAFSQSKENPGPVMVSPGLLRRGFRNVLMTFPVLLAGWPSSVVLHCVQSF